MDGLGITLSNWLTLQVYCTLLVFARCSAAFILLPGPGEPAVPARIRILAALAVAVAIAPGVQGMPTTAPNAFQLIGGVTAEAVVGALLGGLTRTVISGVLIGGQVISQNIALSNVFAMGLAVDETANIGGIFYAGILAVLFATDGHALILRALADSYHVLPPGHFPAMGAGARSMVLAGGQSLRIAGQFALPFLVLGLVFNVSLALLNRAMPALPVFHIANPAIVLLGLYLLAAVVPGLVDSGLSGWPNIASLLQ